jgi:hypothetical protein
MSIKQFEIDIQFNGQRIDGVDEVAVDKLTCRPFFRSTNWPSTECLFFKSWQDESRRDFGNKMKVDEIFVDKMKVDKIFVNKMKVDEIFVDKMKVDKIFVDMLGVEEKT